MPSETFTLERDDAPGTYETVTNDELESALGGQGGTASRHWRFEYRDIRYNLLDELDGAIAVGGSLKMTVDSDIPTTGDLTVYPQRLPFDINEGIHHIAISLVVVVQGLALRMPQGLFRVTAADEEVREDATSTASVKLTDLSDYLLGKTVEPYSIPAGSNVIDSLKVIFDGLGLRHNFAATADITPALISVGPQTPWRTITDRLTSVLNMYPAAPDQQGEFSTERRIVPKATPDQIYHVSEPVILYPRLRRRPDRGGRYANRAVSLFDHPDRIAGYVEVVNSDPSSNISIPALNETITKKLDNGGYLLSPDRAQEYCTWFLRHEHALANKTEIRTTFDPRQGLIRRQYQLSIPGIEEDTQWELLGWSIPLDTKSPMTHLIGRSEAIEVTTLVKPTSA